LRSVLKGGFFSPQTPLFNNSKSAALLEDKFSENTLAASDISWQGKKAFSTCQLHYTEWQTSGNFIQKGSKV